MAFEEYVMGNGLQIGLEPTATHTVSAELRVHAGRVHENENEAGLSHYLEHMLMTGGSTRYRPEEADAFLSSIGHWNATTSTDHTRFFGTMLPADLPAFLDFVADAAFRPKIAPKYHEEQRQRILRECSGKKSDPHYASNLRYWSAFTGGSPYTVEILGSEEVIATTTPDQLLDFHARCYGAKNASLVIVGALPPNIHDAIAQSFKDVPLGKNLRYQWPRLRPIEDKLIMYDHAPMLLNRDYPDESMCDLVVSFNTHFDDHEERIAAKLAIAFLGADPHSRLHKKVSNELGLAYNIGSHSVNLKRGGYGYVNGRVLARENERAIDAIFGEIDEMKRAPPSPEELDRIKKMAMFSVAYSMDYNAEKIADAYSRWDGGLTDEEYLCLVDQVTPERIQRAAIENLPSKDGIYAMLVRSPFER